MNEENTIDQITLRSQERMCLSNTNTGMPATSQCTLHHIGGVHSIAINQILISMKENISFAPYFVYAVIALKLLFNQIT